MTVSFYRSVLQVQDFIAKFFLNSVVTIGFNPANYSVSEGAGSVNVTLSLLSGTLARALSVVLVTSLNDGTATGEIPFLAFMSSIVLKSVLF